MTKANKGTLKIVEHLQHQCTKYSYFEIQHWDTIFTLLCHSITRQAIERFKSVIQVIRASGFNPRPVGLHVAHWKVLCGPFQIFAVVKISYILTTCLYFDNLEFDIFDEDGLQYHFIMPLTIADYLKLNLVRSKSDIQCATLNNVFQSEALNKTMT